MATRHLIMRPQSTHTQAHADRDYQSVGSARCLIWTFFPGWLAWFIHATSPFSLHSCVSSQGFHADADPSTSHLNASACISAGPCWPLPASALPLPVSLSQRCCLPAHRLEQESLLQHEQPHVPMTTFYRSDCTTKSHENYSASIESCMTGRNQLSSRWLFMESSSHW